MSTISFDAIEIFLRGNECMDGCLGVRGVHTGRLGQ
jgi:hypothetical protein